MWNGNKKSDSYTYCYALNNIGYYGTPILPEKVKDGYTTYSNCGQLFRGYASGSQYSSNYMPKNKTWTIGKPFDDDDTFCYDCDNKWNNNKLQTYAGTNVYP